MKFYGIKTLKNGKYNDKYQDHVIWLIWELLSIAIMTTAIIVICNLANNLLQAVVGTLLFILVYFMSSFVVMVYLSMCVSYIGPLGDD